MLVDIWTVIWKEWREILHQRGSIRATVLNQLLLVVIFAVSFSLKAGHGWLETAESLQIWYLLPMLLVMTAIPDSFAGERERHTLETLLASRLSEPAIMLGKIGAAVSYACGLALVAGLLSMAIINITHWDGTVHFYSLGVFLGGIGTSLLIATLVASLGVFVSLRAATVRQAQQSLGLGIFVLAVVPLIVSFLLPKAWKASLAQSLNAASSTQVVLIAVLLLVGLDVILIVAAIRRFKRTQLMLD